MDDTTALKMNVVDVLAPTLPELLNKIDGWHTTVGKKLVLHTAGAELVEAHPGFFTRLLNALIDPNLIPLLFLAGLAGIGFEIFHPGVVLPGALGAVALLLALFGFSVLPISWAGLALLISRRRLTRDRRARDDPWSTDRVGPDQHGRRLAAALPQRAGAVQHVNTPLVIAFAVAIGSFWAIAISKAVAGRAAARSPSAPRRSSASSARRGETASSSSTASCGARAADGEPLRPGQQVRVAGVGPDLSLDVEHLAEE